MSARLVLASASPARRLLLENVGVRVVCEPAAVDEAALKAQAEADQLTVRETALKLAEAKARWVAARQQGAVVLGADQMLSCEDVWYDKPENRQGARAQLQALRGKTHTLVSAVVAVEGDTVLWRHADAAHLSMRSFDDAELDAYLDACGAAIFGSVGGYQLEGRGARLFDHIEGDHFTILGLPLLAVLAFLRERAML